MGWHDLSPGSFKPWGRPSSLPLLTFGNARLETAPQKLFGPLTTEWLPIVYFSC
jgi:hypothetical protein